MLYDWESAFSKYSENVKNDDGHTTILKYSLVLVAHLERLDILDQEVLLDSADVTALYPSTVLETTMNAIQWFMEEHCNNRFPPEAKRFVLCILHFALTETYMKYEGSIYLQITGPAMGVISSVACGNAYLLYCERRVLVVWQSNSRH